MNVLCNIVVIGSLTLMTYLCPQDDCTGSFKTLPHEIHLYLSSTGLTNSILVFEGSKVIIIKRDCKCKASQRNSNASMRTGNTLNDHVIDFVMRVFP